MTLRAGYFEEFLRFWSEQQGVRKIWFSLYTPQIGEASPEILSPEVREHVIEELAALKDRFPKLELPPGMLEAFRYPPSDPTSCIFALTTRSISAAITTCLTPCQLGGKPDCLQCGCVAAAAHTAVGRHRLPIGIRVGKIFAMSRELGLMFKKARGAAYRLSQPRPEMISIPRLGQEKKVQGDND
jgi:hypothetical protein